MARCWGGSVGLGAGRPAGWQWETDKSLGAVQISWLCSAGLGRDDPGMGTCPLRACLGEWGRSRRLEPQYSPKHKLGTTTPSQSVRDTQALCGVGIGGPRTSPTPLTSHSSSRRLPAPCCPLLSHCWDAHWEAFQPRWRLEGKEKWPGERPGGGWWRGH